MTANDLTYCPRCAGTLEVRDAGHPASPHPTCTACGFVLWQNLKPSVEAVIVRNEGPATEVLLGRRLLDDGRTAWDLPGGFLNADDRLHAALQRECLREMGVEVEVGDLLGAYEDDFYGSRIVSLVYVCTILGGEPHAADIIDDVGWFGMSALPEPASPAVGAALAALKQRVLGDT
jgi:ADP-ribose pyrophosphatase YjhB (NUDIX family)